MCRFTRIVDHYAFGAFEIQLYGSIFFHQYDIETAVLEHSVEGAFALSEGYGLGVVVVGDVDGGIFALLVVVVGSLVLIELELSVGTFVDI